MKKFGTGLCILAGVTPVFAGVPAELQVGGTASQTSTLSSTYEASQGLDGSAGTFTHTENLPDSAWIMTFDTAGPIGRVEVVNRPSDPSARMGGLVLRLLDAGSNTVASATLTDPGVGGTWVYESPVPVTAASLRIGLEDGASNDNGDYYVSVAEVRVFPGRNLALDGEAFMVRLSDSLDPAAYGNDDDLGTESKSTTATVDAYWEVDLGRSFALYGARVLAASGLDANMAHTTLRLFDENHDSVYSVHLNGVSLPDVHLGQAYRARYIRVGLENKERTSTGGTWYIGVKEVQAYGVETNEVGILSFTASDNDVAAGQPVTLSWQVANLSGLTLHPGGGSVDAQTGPDGSGSIQVMPAAGSAYVLRGTNLQETVTREVAVAVDGQAPGLRISEFVADNRLSLEDGHGDASDWIELHNPGATVVDLDGYGLSDNPASPMKWTFPSVLLPPHGRLVVFASGNSTPVDPEGKLHADFKLDADGGDLLLTAPDGTPLIDQFLAYPPQGEDLAYGRDLEGAVRFLEPSPGEAHTGTTYDGWLPSSTFSHKRGIYESPFSLEITHSEAGATLLVSSDGSEPSAAYSGPLAISETTTVRAQLVREGYRPAPVKTQTYLLPDALLASTVMRTSITEDPAYAPRLRDGLFALPILCVAVPQLPDDYIERACSLEILWPDGSQAIQADAGVARFGGAYTTFAKKNYRLTFRARYGDKKLEAPLFNGFDRGITVRERFNEIELRGGGHDMEQRGFYMSNRFVEDTMLDMGSLNPHGRFVHLVINGTYWGQYNLRERLTDRMLADYLGGEVDDYFNIRGNDNIGSSFVPGTPEPLARASWDRTRSLRSSYQELKAFVDVPHLIDFMLLYFFGNSETEYRAAGPREAGSGVKFWVGDTDGFLRNTTSDTTNGNGPGSLFSSLRTEDDPDFKMLVADRIYRHFFHDGALIGARNTVRLQARMAEIQDSLILECARWGERSPDNWNAAAQSIIDNLFNYRTGQLLGYLRGRGLYPAFDPPVLSQQGGVVTNGFPLTLVSGAGTIYYTLDGSDPRLPGGGVSPAAQVYSTNGSTELLVPPGAIWRYRDLGTDPDAGWADTNYVDSAWAQGPAELGYGDGDEATTVSYGSNSSQKYTTTYFRHAFSITDPADYSQLEVKLVRDDGAAVYLNGTEVVRDTLPAGALTHQTFALSAAGGSAESDWRNTVVAETSLLVPGTNVVAVEVHQANLTSSDISFNLALEAARAVAGDALVITNETLLRTRVWNNGDWSALNEAHFTLAADAPASAGNLYVTEVYYNPPGQEDGEEFIELYNPGPDVVDLSGASLSNALRFVFAEGVRMQPGTFLLVVEEAAAFDTAYRDSAAPLYFPGIEVAGTWTGRLGNNGETVALVASNGTLIAEIPYETGGDWPARADGKGSSLELRRLADLPLEDVARRAALARGTTWVSSSLYGGSPGRLDEAGRSPLVISELLAHSNTGIDWVEIHNPAPYAVDLSGLHLSDDWDQPFRYTIPASTLLGAEGFLLIDQDDLGFGFSELGSDVLMTASTEGRLHRFIDTLDVPASAQDEGFGRFARCDGETDFTELRALTPGATNALPRVGPLVFSELMVHPATGQVEYVELVNLTDVAVPLYDPAHPTNTWELSGAVEYSFPANIVVMPGEVLLVCATNPAVFRAQAAVDPAIRIFGPWNGRLDNAGESVKLRRPGSPEPDGFVPYPRVDRVAYRTYEPWPQTPPEGGVSLERLPLEAYGNEPCAWTASPPGGTPGWTVTNRVPDILVGGDLVIYQNGGELAWQVWGDDPDAPWQDVSLSLVSAPAGATLDGAGVFRWTPGPAHPPGTYTVTLRVEDDGQPPAVLERNLQLTVSGPFELDLTREMGGLLRLGVPVFDGHTYRLQAGEAPGDWEDLEVLPVADGARWEVLDPVSTQRVYRAIWER